MKVFSVKMQSSETVYNLNQCTLLCLPGLTWTIHPPPKQIKLMRHILKLCASPLADIFGGICESSVRLAGMR